MVLQDDVGLRLAHSPVALGNLPPLDDVVGSNVGLQGVCLLIQSLLDLQIGGQLLVLHLHPVGGLPGRLLRLRGHTGNAVAQRLGLQGQHRLILHEQRGGRVARAVEIVLGYLLRQQAAQITGHLLRLAHINAQHLGPGIGAAYQRRISHVGQPDIIGIDGLPRRLLPGFQAGHLFIDTVKLSRFAHAGSSSPWA